MSLALRSISRRQALLAASGVLLSGQVHSGQDCGERAAPTPAKLASASALGARVVQQLDQSGASLALVARIGLDLSEFGQRFTHMGLVWRDATRSRWRSMHLMNACGSTTSEILEQPAQSFFETQLFIDEALVVVPSYPLQVRWMRVFLGTAAQRLHEAEYNLIAHPFNTRYQNSNQWLLEVAAAGLMTPRPQARSEVQAWLQQQGYQPSSIRISNLRRSAARLFSPHVHFTDHSQQELEQQLYQVVTVDSIVAFLRRFDAQMRVSTVN